MNKFAGGFPMDSKILLAIIILAAALVLAAPILYKLTKKQLRHSSQNDIDNLSGKCCIYFTKFRVEVYSIRIKIVHNV